ncbi:hypothetical protein [Roseateles sp. L2-2]|uniref:hypothetical protein n=1 Tax=Roseateles sp. L2-2 TaxID=3422597 RepID=UPI003D367869
MSRLRGGNFGEAFSGVSDASFAGVLFSVGFNCGDDGGLVETGESGSGTCVGDAGGD